MNYKKFSTDDLIASYSAMIDYSGKANPQILEEIENRGGLENFLRTIEQKKIRQQEVNRIVREMIALSTTSKEAGMIKAQITSDILSKEDLDQLIELKFEEYQKELADRTIDIQTFIKSFIGIIIGALSGTVFFISCILFCERIVYFPIIGVYIISYFSIKLITKQSRNNLVVFIASVLATIIAIVLTFVINILFSLTT